MTQIPRPEGISHHVACLREAEDPRLHHYSHLSEGATHTHLATPGPGVSHHEIQLKSGTHRYSVRLVRVPEANPALVVLQRHSRLLDDSGAETGAELPPHRITIPRAALAAGHVTYAGILRDEALLCGLAHAALCHCSADFDVLPLLMP